MSAGARTVTVVVVDGAVVVVDGVVVVVDDGTDVDVDVDDGDASVVVVAATSVSSSPSDVSTQSAPNTSAATTRVPTAMIERSRRNAGFRRVV
jgi:hypothetical protein